MSGRAAADADRRAAEEALGRLEAGEGMALGALPDPAVPDETARFYAELLGLLAAEPPPVPPSAGLSGRVLAAVRRGGRPPVPFPRRVTAAPPPRRAPAPRWLAATAAGLLLAVLGLAGYAGWLHHRLEAESYTVDRLARELADTRHRAAALARLQGALERRSVRLASELSLVATPGVEVCPLAPVGPSPPHPEARGLLFLAPEGESWYVRLANLEPPPPGRAYRVWFLTAGGGAMDGGELVAGAGDELSLTGRRLPGPDRMRGAAVTLERAGASPRRPGGPMVLFGDEKMTIL